MRPGARVYVQTRGTARAADYAFLDGAPPHPWWRDYRDLTAFDHPTVLVASTGGGWVAYLSGVPSARTDAVGTTVRYTLVLDGPCGDGPVADQVPAAVAAWLDDVADGFTTRPGGRLSAALDARFPVADVQRFLDGDGEPRPPVGCGRTVLSEPGERVLAALAALPVPQPPPDAPGDWVGGVGAPAARTAFVARTAALVAGAPGRALLLNLAGPDDAATLLDPAADLPVGPAASLAVLVESASPARPIAVAPVMAKKAPAPAASRSGTVTVLAMTALAVLVTTLAAIAILLL